MTTVLLFLVAVFAGAGWWLSHQRLTSKPWLESGLESIEDGTDRISLPRTKIGLIVFLSVVGTLFALFVSGYFMRQEQLDWRAMPLPNALWLNTALLILCSFTMQFALRAARNNDRNTVKTMLVLANVLTLSFLAGQLIAWQQLVQNGFGLTGNPANSFFYFLTGIHGLHIIGGLVALARTTTSAWRDDALETLQPRIDLCALYWHFLLFIWLAVLVVMLGWVSDPFFDVNQH